MKNLLLLITLITLSCNQPEPFVTFYNADSTDGYILKIISDESGIISQELEDAEWENVTVDTTSKYITLVRISEKLERDVSKRKEDEKEAFENWLNE